MDTRTRERLPVLPTLVAWVAAERARTAELLAAAEQTRPGEVFTAAGTTLRRAVLKTQTTGRVWAEHPDTGRRRDLSFEEHCGFWTWAVVEVLRHTASRNCTELSHHSLIQYRLPTTGELIPLLQIVPSKTDTERLLPLARTRRCAVDHCRPHPRRSARRRAGGVLRQERTRLQPAPAAAVSMAAPTRPPRGQRDRAAHLPRPRTHRDRRQRCCRPTDALHLPRLPPVVHHRRHRARHASAHRPTRRRPPRHQHHHGIQGRLPRGSDHRPPRLHRPPPRAAPRRGIPHPHRRRMGRVRRPLPTPQGRHRRLQPLLRHPLHPRTQLSTLPAAAPDPSAKARLEEIRDNLLARIAEAESHRWYGEAEGLRVSLVGANTKLAQMDQISASRTKTVQLGIPSFTDTAGRTTDSADDRNQF